MYAVFAFVLLGTTYYQFQVAHAPQGIAYLMLAAALVSATMHITRGSKMA